MFTNVAGLDTTRKNERNTESTHLIQLQIANPEHCCPIYSLPNQLSTIRDPDPCAMKCNMC